MILINEWLPNPVGNDMAGEWVEIFNSGGQPLSLNGWRIENNSGKKFYLKGEIVSGEYKVLKRSETKLALQNQSGELKLYDSKGSLIQTASFYGSAAEGKSFSRTASGIFLATEPTPGAANKFLAQVEGAKTNFEFGRPINDGLGFGEILILALGSAIFITALIIFLIKRNEYLSNLFFGGNEEGWQ